MPAAFTRAEGYVFSIKNTLNSDIPGQSAFAFSNPPLASRPVSSLRLKNVIREQG
nr:hypothetical protein [Acetobacter persici]